MSLNDFSRESLAEHPLDKAKKLILKEIQTTYQDEANDIAVDYLVRRFATDSRSAAIAGGEIIKPTASEYTGKRYSPETTQKLKDHVAGFLMTWRMSDNSTLLGKATKEQVLADAHRYLTSGETSMVRGRFLQKIGEGLANGALVESAWTDETARKTLESVRSKLSRQLRKKR